MNDMRYLASVVTQCFTAFGELLALNKRFAELSGGVTRHVPCPSLTSHAPQKTHACPLKTALEMMWKAHFVLCHWLGGITGHVQCPSFASPSASPHMLPHPP